MGRALLIGASFLALAAGVAFAETPMIATPDSMQWKPVTQLGPGVQMTVLSGDPSKSGPYVMRLKFPANTAIPAHMHGGTENITVISGDLGVGLGDKADKSKGQQLPAGSFAIMPAHTPHFAWANAETIVQIHGMGPTDTQMMQAASGTSQ